MNMKLWSYIDYYCENNEGCDTRGSIVYDNDDDTTVDVDDGDDNYFDHDHDGDADDDFASLSYLKCKIRTHLLVKTECNNWIDYHH